MKHELLIIISLFINTLDESFGEYIVRETNLGLVKGKITQYGDVQIEEYFGVPFAIPPRGKLRFKRPVPVQPWGNNTRDATSFLSACPQFSPSPFPWYDNFTGHSEDCLHLNIWVPSRQRKGLAVFYWMFSGGMTFGSNRLPVYHGQVLAAIGNIIVVTVNYRLGALGFLYSGTDDAPGNVGLYDALLGLKWVNENIDAFGGDPKRITIGGHSAGSMISQYFTTSLLAGGLYSRAILQSGSVAYPILSNSKERNFDLGQKLADKVGCSEGKLRSSPDIVVDCLRGIDAINLTHTLGMMLPRTSMTFLPVMGDPILGDDPVQQIVNGDFNATDILVGNVPNEAAFAVAASYSAIFGFYGLKNDRINKSFAEYILRKEAFSQLSRQEGLFEYFLGNVRDDDETEILQQTATAFSDVALICPSIYYADATALKNKNAYYYVFDRRPSTTDWAPWMGVVHFDEVQFVFGQPILNKKYYTTEEYNLSIWMMKLWTNFINNGRPDDDWPLYNTKDQVVRVLFDSNTRIYQQDSHIENCNFLRKYILSD